MVGFRDGVIGEQFLVKASAGMGLFASKTESAVKCSTMEPKHASKLPRQVLADMKWEWETYMSPTDLAKCRRGQEECILPAQSEEEDECDAVLSERPPKPADPEEDRDDTGRSKDKDAVPSRMTWRWCNVANKWVLRERPRMPVAGIFFCYSPIPPKQIVLLKFMLNRQGSVINEDFLRTELVPRLNRKHVVSLRLLDWLVVDYSRAKNVAYTHYVHTIRRKMIVPVHELYAALRNQWRRRRFDPFRRRRRIYFELDSQVYSTTVAQLHFFCVAKTYGFLEYAMENIKKIDRHMKRTLERTAKLRREQKRKGGPKHRRKPLVKKAVPRSFVSVNPYMLSFDVETHGT
jgi:hypothetical protein